MSLKFTAAVLATTLLGACAPLEGMFNATSPGAVPARCQASGAESVLGKTAEARVISEAILGAGALRSRIIKPGEAVTTDADALRLNIEVDQTGKITRLRCG